MSLVIYVIKSLGPRDKVYKVYWDLGNKTEDSDIK